MDRGPFALVRHPIYGGVILGFVGLSLKGGNVYAAVLSLLLVPFFYAKTEHEERLLAAQFPEYVEYRQRVRRRHVDESGQAVEVLREGVGSEEAYSGVQGLRL